MANLKQLHLGLQTQEKLLNAKERFELAKETQAIYESILADPKAVMSDVIKLAALKADEAVLATKIQFDEAQKNLHLIKRTPAHFNDDDYDGSYANDGYNVDGYDVNGYDVDGYDVDGYDVDGYNVDGYDVEGYDVDGYNIFGISAVTVDSYE